MNPTAKDIGYGSSRYGRPGSLAIRPINGFSSQSRMLFSIGTRTSSTRLTDVFMPAGHRLLKSGLSRSGTRPRCSGLSYSTPWRPCDELANHRHHHRPRGMHRPGNIRRQAGPPMSDERHAAEGYLKSTGLAIPAAMDHLRGELGRSRTWLAKEEEATAALLRGLVEIQKERRAKRGPRRQWKQ
jgi:hypothetical protein